MTDTTMEFLRSLELSNRAVNALYDWRREWDLDKFLRVTQDELLNMPRIGVRTATEIMDAQARLRAGPDPTVYETIRGLVGTLNSLMTKHPKYVVLVQADGCLTLAVTSQTDAYRRAERNGWSW